MQNCLPFFVFKTACRRATEATDAFSRPTVLLTCTSSCGDGGRDKFSGKTLSQTCSRADLLAHATATQRHSLWAVHRALGLDLDSKAGSMNGAGLRHKSLVGSSGTGDSL